MNTSKGLTLFAFIIASPPHPKPDIVVGFDARLIRQNRGGKEWEWEDFDVALIDRS